MADLVLPGDFRSPVEASPCDLPGITPLEPVDLRSIFGAVRAPRSISPTEGGADACACLAPLLGLLALPTYLLIFRGTIAGGDVFAVSGPMPEEFVIRGVGVGDSSQATLETQVSFRHTLATSAGATGFDAGAPLFSELSSQDELTFSGPLTIGGLWTPVQRGGGRVMVRFTTPGVPPAVDMTAFLLISPLVPLQGEGQASPGGLPVPTTR